MSDCAYESDVIDALASRRWPARAGDALRAHVSACASCRDLAAVADALMSEGELAQDQSRVPPAASVWHRAQLRAREEAVRAAARPIGFAQGMAFAFGIAAALAAAAWGLPIAAALLPDVSQLAGSLRAPSLSMPGSELASSLLMNTTLQLAAAACVIVTTVTLYFTLRDTNP